MSRRSELIKRANDKFRRDFQGGRVMLTAGIVALGALAQNEIVKRVQQFDAFDRDNDPHSEHDFGAFDYAGHKVFWKIDAYDLKYEYGSEDPTDPLKTRRVLTIMLASEY